MKMRILLIALLVLKLTVVSWGTSEAMTLNKPESFFEGPELKAVKALENGDEAGLKEALSSGADINRPGRLGVLPFLYFIAANNTPAMVRLHKMGARFDYELPRALGPKFPENFGAVPSNPDVTMLKALLEAKLDPNFRPRGGWTLIFWTMSPFNRKAFDLLLHYGADINAKEPLGGTVLHEAVYMQDYKLAHILVEHGANPIIRKVNGVTIFDVLKKQKSRAKRGSPVEKEIDALLEFLKSKGYQ